MPRVTRHACARYWTRRLRPRRGAWIPLSVAERYAREALAGSRLVTREEAAALVGPIADHSWNRYYRIDAAGDGVWVTCWHKGEEVILTYLHKPVRKAEAGAR